MPQHHVKLERYIFNDPQTCEGKRRYARKNEAEIVKQEQELLNSGLKLSIYPCSNGCSGWHLTRVKTEEDNN